MAITLPTIIGLALVDALNPFSLAALVYLLGTPNPLRNGWLFIGGTYGAYVLGGLLLLAGWQSLINFLAPLLPWWFLGAIELVGGAALLVLSIWLWTKARSGKTFAPPPDLSTFAVLAFAVTSTIADLTSAIPYFGAVNVLVLDQSLSSAGRALAIGVYCVFYCSPLIAMVSVRAVLKEISDGVFLRVRSWVDWALAKLSAPLTLLCAVVLMIDGVRRLLG